MGGGRFVVLKASSKGRLRLIGCGGEEEERVEGGDEGRGARTREPYVRLTFVDIVVVGASVSTRRVYDSSTVM
jgi:hypothetical protein